MVNKYKTQAGGKLIIESYDRLLDAWGVEKKELGIDTSYGKTHIVTAGTPGNPPLILFHGVGDDTSLMWLYNAAALAADFRIYAVDTMGGPGKSEPNELYFKNFSQTGWIDEILDGLGVDKAYIIGVSNGAYLTMLYSIKRPEKVIKSVCMAGGAGGGGMLRMLKFIPAALFPSQGNIKRLMKMLCGLNTDNLFRNELLMEHWGYLLKHFNTRSMMYQKMTRITDEDLPVLKDKTLFLLGESDGLSNLPKAVEKLEKNFLSYKVIKNAGHAMNHQQPDLINREIVDFLLKS